MDELFAKTNPYCAAILFGGFSEVVLSGSAKSIEGQGTMTFARYRDRFFGFTNEHVLADLPDNRGDRVWHLALSSHIALALPPIARTRPDNQDAPFDLAIFELSADVVRAVVRGGKAFVDVPDVSRLSDGDDAVAIGFPGGARRIHGRFMVHPTFLVAATCANSSDRTIVMHQELPDEKRTLLFGGMSGGPIFRLTETSIEFSGIIVQGSGPNERRSDDREVWIWGIPITQCVVELTLAARR